MLQRAYLWQLLLGTWLREEIIIIFNLHNTYGKTFLLEVTNVVP